MTKFIVDANLPPELAVWLTNRKFNAIPVRRLGVQGVTDDGIWAWALEHRAVIVTKDEDFPSKRARTSSGPQVVWLRIGNSTKRALFAWLDKIWDQVAIELDAGAAVIEVR